MLLETEYELHLLLQLLHLSYLVYCKHLTPSRRGRVVITFEIKLSVEKINHCQS